MVKPALESVVKWSSHLALVSACVVVVLIGLGVLPPRASGPPRVEDVEETLVASEIRNVMGEGSIALVAFSDFECPFCKTYATESIPEIRERFVDTGQVRYVAVHYPLTRIHPNARGLAIDAECASDFWATHDAIYAADSAAVLQEANSGETDCADRARAEGSVQADMALGDRLGVAGTPTFFLGRVRPDGGIDLTRRFNSGPPPDVLAEEIERLAEG